MKRKGDVMALIKCPECGNQISDKAESCPKCGYELNKKETPTTSDNKVASSFMNKGNIKYILIILAIIVAGVGVTAFTGNENWTSKICTILSFALALGGVIINLLLLMEIIPPFIV